MAYRETRTTLSLLNEAIEIDYEKNRGRWSLSSRQDSRYGIADISLTVMFGKGASSSAAASTRDAYLRTWRVEPFSNQLGSGQQLVVTSFGREDSPDIVQVIRLYELERYVTCGAIIRNSLAERIELSEARLELKPKLGATYEYSHAEPVTVFLDNSYSYETPTLQVLEKGKIYSGWNYAVLYLNDVGTFAGSIREGKALPLLQVGRSDTEIIIRCRSNFGSLGLETGAYVESGEFLLIAGMSVSDIQEEYSRALRRLIRIEQTEQPLISWQLSPRRETTSTEHDMKRVLDGLAHKLHALGVKYIEVGEGWQRDIGDWTPSENFPGGLKSVSEKIREAGFLPGIWIAPLIVSEKSVITSENPGWLISGVDRNPMKVRLKSGGEFFLLNPAKPEVRDRLQRLIGGLVNESGFELIVVDSTYPLTYLDFAINEGETAASLHNQLMKTVNSAALGQLVVLSNCLVGQSIGYAKGVRIGEPIVGYEQLLRESRATSLRYFLNQDLLPLATNAFDTEKLGLEHFRSWATFSAIVCRSITISASDLSPGREEILANLLPISQELFQPLFPTLSQGNTAVWTTPAVQGSSAKAAVFNWSPVLKKVEISFRNLGLEPTRQYAAIERWNREFLGIHIDGLEIDVPPGGCRVLFIFDANQSPLLLFGSRNHLVDGPLEAASWDSSKSSLRGEFTSMPGTEANLMLYCPPTLSPKSLHAIGCEYSMEIVNENVVGLLFTPRTDRVKWMLTLRKSS